MRTQAMEIAKLNDVFRTENTASFILTRGVLSQLDEIRAVAKVRQFDRFTDDNDPYGEHDFGSFELDGEKLFWKIDYYDRDLRSWCDPLRADCRRVLTVMLAEEY